MQLKAITAKKTLHPVNQNHSERNFPPLYSCAHIFPPGGAEQYDKIFILALSQKKFWRCWEEVLGWRRGFEIKTSSPFSKPPLHPQNLLSVFKTSSPYYICHNSPQCPHWNLNWELCVIAHGVQILSTPMLGGASCDIWSQANSASTLFVWLLKLHLTT